MEIMIDGGAVVSARLRMTPTHSRNALAHTSSFASGPSHTPKYSALPTIGMPPHLGAIPARAAATWALSSSLEAWWTGASLHFGTL
eukprot:3096349-Pyramimonas_sp.AAC.1